MDDAPELWGAVLMAAPMGGSGVSRSKTRRTQVEAIDDLTAQLRLSNQIAVLALGATALEHEKRVTDASKARVDRRNALRAAVRAGLGIEETKE
jgi:hypothetical protein